MIRFLQTIALTHLDFISTLYSTRAGGRLALLGTVGEGTLLLGVPPRGEFAQSGQEEDQGNDGKVASVDVELQERVTK